MNRICLSLLVGYTRNPRKAPDKIWTNLVQLLLSLDYIFPLGYLVDELLGALVDPAHLEAGVHEDVVAVH